LVGRENSDNQGNKGRINGNAENGSENSTATAAASAGQALNLYLPSLYKATLESVMARQWRRINNYQRQTTWIIQPSKCPKSLILWVLGKMAFMHPFLFDFFCNYFKFMFSFILHNFLQDW